jgi:hypothetical protein
MPIHLQDVVVKVDIELHLVFEESQSLTLFLGFCFPYLLDPSQQEAISIFTLSVVKIHIL